MKSNKSRKVKEEKKQKKGEDGNTEHYIIKDKYQVLNWAKGGGFGDIFIARHITKGYEVAIKFVS